MLLYLRVLLGVLAWKYVPRPWHPGLILQTPRHIVYSTASKQETEETNSTFTICIGGHSPGSCSRVRRTGALPWPWPSGAEHCRTLSAS